MAKIKSRVSDEATSQFTSMIDIVFLLLIFFILQPFKAPELQLGSNLPTGDGTQSVNSLFRKNIQLRINPDPDSAKNAIYIVDDRIVGKSNAEGFSGIMLSEILKKRSLGQLDTPVSINAKPNVPFRHVLDALDACNRAGMQDVRWGAPDPSYRPLYMRK